MVWWLERVRSDVQVRTLLRLYEGLYHYAFVWDPEPPCVVRHSRGLIAYSDAALGGACMPAERSRQSAVGGIAPCGAFHLSRCLLQTQLACFMCCDIVTACPSRWPTTQGGFHQALCLHRRVVMEVLGVDHDETARLTRGPCCVTGAKT